MLVRNPISRQLSMAICNTPLINRVGEFAINTVQRGTDMSQVEEFLGIGTGSNREHWILVRQ